MTSSLETLEKIIGTAFADKDLLREALTHRSYLNERPHAAAAHNERLEYLGDAVLELAVSEELFRRFPDFPEGQLTVLRAALVNYQRLATVALDIGLEKHIRMSRGEARDTGKAREVILANAFEAVVGALYLDRGFNAVAAFIKKFVFAYLEEIMATRSYKDAKSELQELAQDVHKVTPTYRTLTETGPAHKRTFTVGVYFGEKQIAEGTGASKQEAETEAARAALAHLRKK